MGRSYNLSTVAAWCITRIYFDPLFRAVWPPHAPSSEIPYIIYTLFQISLGANRVFDRTFPSEAIKTRDGAPPLQQVEPVVIAGRWMGAAFMIF